MYPLRLALFALVIAPFLSAQGSVTQSSDGMALLQRMSDHYAGASSWYIEATSERTSATEYNRSWTKTVLISAVSGNKYHYEATRREVQPSIFPMAKQRGTCILRNAHIRESLLLPMAITHRKNGS